MDGYEMWSDSVNIDPEKEIAIAVEFQIKAGSVSIKSEPPNAMVIIDGKRTGSSPETLTDIEPGKHLVKIKMKAGSININSQPPNAMVLIDGKKAGSTPETLTDIKPGKHLVEVKMEGYAEWVKKINMKKVEEITLNASTSVY